MRALYKEPGKPARFIDVENTLEALQEKVGGYIETVTVAPNACIICNEEGRLRGMPYNMIIRGVPFVGPILVVGVDGEDYCDVPAVGFLYDMFVVAGR